MIRTLKVMASVAVAMTLTGVGGTALAQTTGATGTSGTETESRNLAAYAELLRADLRTQKVAVITEVMGFNEAEDKAFWPLYREYETQLAKLNDERIAGIQEYAKNYEQLSDEVADRLAKKALDLEAQRTAVKTAFYGKLRSAVPAKTAARFLQVENQILLLIDLQIAASLPVVK